jgi:hypothetical protein
MASGLATAGDPVSRVFALAASVLPAWLTSPPPQPKMASRDDVATGATTAVQSTPAPQEEEEAEGSPSLTGKPRACANKTLPEQFFAFNPEFLDDADKWSYRDLQGLAKQLGVPGGGKGSRAALVKKLKDWNRENDEALEEDPERWPQQASNFNLLPVDIGVKHAQATGVCRLSVSPSLTRLVHPCRRSSLSVPVFVAAANVGDLPAGLTVEVPQSLQEVRTGVIGSPCLPLASFCERF